MRIEDPGWGDYVPPPEEQGKEPAGQMGGSPPTSGPPSKPPRDPWWRSRSGIALGLGVAVAVVVAVAAAGRGGDSGAGPSPTTTGVPTTTAVPTTTTGYPTPLAGGTDQYQANANSICANHRPAIATAYNAMAASGDPSGLISALQSLQVELQGLGDAPAEVGANTYMDDLDRWIKTFQEGDLAGAQVWQSAMATHSKEAGMQNCPPN